MVPGIAFGIARNSAGNPVLSSIAPSVPFVATINPAFVPPDVGFSVHKLVNVKLQRLRITGISNPEINVIGKVMEGGSQCLAEVRKSLRREVTDQVIIPQYVSPLRGAAVVAGFGRNAVHRRRTDVGRPGPLRLGSCRS